MDYTNLAVQDIVGTADIIVVQRNLILPQVWEAIDYWRGLGRVVVADLDDDYPKLPHSNPAHAFWINNQGELPEPPIKILTEGLRHCDGLTSPSKVILEDWQEVVNGYWLPNYARGDWWLKAKHRTPDDKIIIGWGGSVSHYDSWWFSGIKEAMSRVCEKHPNVYVQICGNDPRLLEQLPIPAAQKIYQTGVDPADWVKVVATFDIGVAPLDMRMGRASYDNHRSWIKALEYMLGGVPWVASKSDVYAELAQYGTVVDNTADDWADALERVIANLDAQKRAARRNRRAAWGMTLEANVDSTIKLYESIKEKAQKNLPQLFYVNWGDSIDVARLRELRAKAAPALSAAAEQARQSAPTAREIQASHLATVKGWLDRHLRIGGFDYGRQALYAMMQRING
jgi:glycosyltransferase involved in cell wall biosynthesis